MTAAPRSPRRRYSQKEAEKKLTATAWKEEEKLLQFNVGVEGWKYLHASKPIEFLKDPSKDPLKSKGINYPAKTGDGIPPIKIPLPPISLELSPERIQKVIDEAIERVIQKQKEEPLFSDSEDPLESGRAKYEEVKERVARASSDNAKGSSEIWNPSWYMASKELTEAWVINPMRYVYLMRDELLTRDWNELCKKAKNCFLYQNGSHEYFRLVYAFHPLLIAVCEPNVRDEGSLFASHIELKRQFDWYQLSDEMEGAITLFKDYLESNDCSEEYVEAINRTRGEIRRNISTFKEAPNRWQLIIMEYLYIRYSLLFYG